MLVASVRPDLGHETFNLPSSRLLGEVSSSFEDIHLLGELEDPSSVPRSDGAGKARKDVVQEPQKLKEDETTKDSAGEDDEETDRQFHST